MIALFIVLSLVTVVAGQLLLKLALNRLNELEAGDPRRRQAGWIFAGSIASMALSFFVNIGLLQKLDLSYLFPFQDLSMILIAICSTIFLKERLSAPLIIGILLVTGGVILVSAS